VREAANAHELGARGVALERAIFARRKADARDSEKRESYESLPASAKLELSALVTHVSSQMPARIVRRFDKT
jgi:hypothetical protein